ncbi:hypothetical protein B0H17DRAFT_1211164 [Mycena rosella]|uniref:Uncharacterized protein n=1 Tax=Mycena rosella TaxID=1033263 RepID=A0AAD7CVA6_MYCRO|nr:hypothetical protein B0H17DRAFT_1211164 [Mycena rosella]
MVKDSRKGAGRAGFASFRSTESGVFDLPCIFSSFGIPKHSASNEFAFSRQSRETMGNRPKREQKRIPKEDRKSLRLWVEGARETVLAPHIAPYAAKLAMGWMEEHQYLQKVCKEYNARIDWRIGDNEKPELAAFDPLAKILVEVLLEEDERAKSTRLHGLEKHIRRWLKYRSRRLRKGGQIKVDLRKDPWAVLLAKLSGVNSPPKACQAYQQFMHEEYTTTIRPEILK